MNFPRPTRPHFRRNQVRCILVFLQTIYLRPDLLGIQGHLKYFSGATVPVRGISYLHVKGRDKPEALDIYRSGSPDKRNCEVSARSSPVIIELGIDGKVFIVQTRIQVVVVNLVYLVLQLALQIFVVFEAIQHLKENLLVRGSCARGVYSGQVEGILLRHHEGHRIQQLIRIGVAIYHKLFTDHQFIAQSCSHSSSIDSRGRLFRPAKFYVNFQFPPIDDDDIFSPEGGSLIGVPVIEGRFDVDFPVGGSAGDLVADFLKKGNLFLYLGEGAIEFVLFSQGIGANEAHMGGVAVVGQHNNKEQEQKDEQMGISFRHQEFLIIINLLF